MRIGPNNGKTLILVILALILFILSGCSTELKDGDIVVMPGQNPEVASKVSANQNITQNSYMGLSNANSNLQNYYIRQQGNTVLNIPLQEKWLDFDVIDSFLYLLVKTGENSSGTEFGNKITIYDVDGQQLLNSIAKDEAMYVSTAQLNNKIYLYDIGSGELHKYSTDLKLEETIPLHQGLDCSKMCFSKDGWLIMLVYEEDSQLLYIFDRNFKLKFKINPSELAVSPVNTKQKQPDIRDFDVYDSDRIVLKIIPQRLCLFNFKKGVVEKTAYMANDESIICFDSNILYSSATSLPVTNKGSANTPNQLTRLFLNESYTWSLENKNNEKWFITPIELPSNGLLTVHQKMKCRGRFIYMLDYPLENNNLKESEIIIVSK